MTRRLYRAEKLIMTKNIRITHELEFLLEQAAQVSGVSQSRFIRAAVIEKRRMVLRPRLSESLAPFIGRVKSHGGRARSTGFQFKRALTKKNAREF